MTMKKLRSPKKKQGVDSNNATSKPKSSSNVAESEIATCYLCKTKRPLHDFRYKEPYIEKQRRSFGHVISDSSNIVRWWKVDPGEGGTE